MQVHEGVLRMIFSLAHPLLAYNLTPDRLGMGQSLVLLRLHRAQLYLTQ